MSRVNPPTVPAPAQQQQQKAAAPPPSWILARCADHFRSLAGAPRETFALEIINATAPASFNFRQVIPTLLQTISAKLGHLGGNSIPADMLMATYQAKSAKSLNGQDFGLTRGFYQCSGPAPIVAPIIGEPLPPFAVEYKNSGDTVHMRLRPTSVDLGSYQLTVKSEENLSFHFSREAELQLITDQQLYRMVADHIGKAGLNLTKMQSV
eukprot:7378663-Prymnesium_polylepis.1